MRGLVMFLFCLLICNCLCLGEKVLSAIKIIVLAYGFFTVFFILLWLFAREEMLDNVARFVAKQWEPVLDLLIKSIRF